MPSNDGILRTSRDFYDYEIYSDDEDPEDTAYLNNDSDRIISAIVNNDLQALKRHLTTPKKIKDRYGYGLLHIAIYKERKEIFDYLLSLGYDIEETCPDGESALALSLSGFAHNDIPIEGDHFAAELVDKGADLNISTYEPSWTALHFAIDRNFVRTTKLLIAKNLDLDLRTDDDLSPLQMILCSSMSTSDKIELTAMMIYYGVQITTADFNTSLEYRESEIQEMLVDFVFDEDNFDYRISALALSCAMQSESQVLERVKNRITGIDDLTYTAMNLFKVKSHYLEWLMENFKFETRMILTHATLQTVNINGQLLNNLDILFHSRLKFELLSKYRQTTLLTDLYYGDVPLDSIREYLYFVLSHGVDLHDEDLDNAYRKYGYSEFFKELLMFDVEKKEDYARHILPLCAHDVTSHITDILSNLSSYSEESLVYFLSYCSRPALVEFCKKLSDFSGLVEEKMKVVPTVSTLKELARDETRSFLVERYSVKSARMFYTILKRLPIPEVLEKMISFELSLY